MIGKTFMHHDGQEVVVYSVRLNVYGDGLGEEDRDRFLALLNMLDAALDEFGKADSDIVNVAVSGAQRDMSGATRYLDDQDSESSQGCCGS